MNKILKELSLRKLTVAWIPLAFLASLLAIYEIISFRSSELFTPLPYGIVRLLFKMTEGLNVIFLALSFLLSLRTKKSIKMIIADLNLPVVLFIITLSMGLISIATRIAPGPPIHKDLNTIKKEYLQPENSE